jgi:hypothetical protein
MSPVRTRRAPRRPLGSRAPARASVPPRCSRCSTVADCPPLPPRPGSNHPASIELYSGTAVTGRANASPPVPRAPLPGRAHRCSTPIGIRPTVAASAVTGAIVLHRLGTTYGSTRAERKQALPGDDRVRCPQTVATHARTIAAPPQAVWPWLVQVGWHRGGWYTPRWVDRLLFPENQPSAWHLLEDLQHIAVGDVIPDGPPQSECGFVVREVQPCRSLVLHSTTHLPLSWRRRGRRVTWTWAFLLSPTVGGTHTPAGVPVAGAHPPVVAHRRHPRRHRPGGLRDGPRHAPRPRPPGRAAGAAPEMTTRARRTAAVPAQPAPSGAASRRASLRAAHRGR